ncbi:MAG: tetratricopeptide repeat protein [Phycisphaerales bacterium]|nr:tetratricopeptide repeat protein [Phycisphaerales bacterium]
MVDDRSAKDVFGDAVELSRELRAEFLGGACGGDSALRAEVESLLEIYDQSRGFLAAPTQCREAEAAWGPGDGSDHALGLPAEGTVIGRYRLGPLLGEGGFGVVFSAVQTAPVRRQVALKVIKLGMDTRQVVARFEIERQALAMMDHPHIAKVLDAGATETGRPYFVMDLVPGEPITAYCDRLGLSLRDRLGVFLQICSAVQHAHQKGIIHRDLKPGNILVSEQDNRPHVKIVDFGIAKATTDSGGHTRTEHRRMMGTPEYMSPEQATGSGDIDTRADVYALGSLLYELLTSVTPFDRERLCAATPGQFERILTEEHVPRPSTRRSALPGHAPADLVKALRGDLDWVVMRCLEKDRNRRYATVNGLALDIERFLRNEPVSARPPTPAYTLRKLMRRHRVAFRAAAAVAAAVLLGLAAASYGIVRASRQHARAEAVSAVLRDTLRLADPAQTRGEHWNVSDLLNQAVQRLDAGALRGQPLAEADVRATISVTYLALALHDDAEVQLTLAESILAAQRGDKHPETLRLRALRMKLLVDRGLYAEAEALSARTLPAMRRVLGSLDTDVLRTVSRRAAALRSLGRFEEAAVCGREALSGLRRTLGDHPDTADAMRTLGNVYVWIGRYNDAEHLGREAVDISTRALGPEHPETLHMTHLLGLALSKQNKFEEGVRWERFTLESRRRILPPDHPDTLRITANLGDTMTRAGRLDEAESLEREAFEGFRRTLGAGNALTISTQRTLSTVLIAQSRLTDALGVLRDAVANAEAELGLLHPETFYTQRSLGRTLSLLGESDAGVEYLKKALRAGRQIQGDDNPQTLATHTFLANALLRQGRYAEAEESARHAVEGFRRGGLPHNDDSRHAMSTLAKVLRASGRPHDALPLLEEIRGGWRGGPLEGLTAARLNYAECLLDLGRTQEARVELLEIQASVSSSDAAGEASARLHDMLRRARDSADEGGRPAE